MATWVASLTWLLPAWLLGLSSGLHCFSMCSGIVTALSQGQAPSVQVLQPKRELLRRQLAYNLGRISMYAVLGGAFASVGLVLLGHPSWRNLQRLGYLLANLMLIYLAVAGLLARAQSPRWLEYLAQPLWRVTAGLRRGVSANSRLSVTARNYLTGMLWGFLPCGLLYSMLAVALGLGSIPRGMAWMLAFGLGTLPNLLLIGGLSAQIRRWSNHVGFRWLLALYLGGMGVLGLMRLMGLGVVPAVEGFCLPAAF